MWTLLTRHNSQAEGCTVELWDAHKRLLRDNFSRLVHEAKAECWGVCHPPSDLLIES